MDWARECAAQATVEAALLIPSFLTLMLLALQPVCMLYTRGVMEAAAAETARLMITSDTTPDTTLKAFALRRLAAVPDVSMFHAGGPAAWDIALTRAVATGSEVKVVVRGAVTPLPVLGIFAGALGTTNAHGDVEMEVTVAYEGRPSWLEGDYDTWVEAWG
ncbi:TadE/TadG family type IV pilus assembly protein [Collinsella tanakaei]|uniref:TadE/TadG family type IV pilus assembly protein n=1 Tax=Collinsella tanakaei TaxID=626935 RepID=UPI00315A8DD1